MILVDALQTYDVLVTPFRPRVADHDVHQGVEAAPGRYVQSGASSLGMTDALGDKTSVTDAVGDKTLVTDALEDNASVADALGDNTSVTDALGANASVTDALGDNASVTDALEDNMSVTYRCWRGLSCCGD